MKTANNQTLSGLQLQAKDLDTAQLREITVQGRTIPEDRDYAVWNLKQNHISSFVKKGYNIVQHKEVIDAATDVLINLGVNCKCKLFDFEDRVMVDIDFIDSKKNIMEGEEFISGLRIVNSYDKTTGIMILPRLVRLACSNGMVTHKAWVCGYNIKHTKKIKEDFLEVVEKMMIEMINGDEKLKTMINNCMQDSIEYETMQLIMTKLATSKKKMEELKSILERDCGVKDKYTRWEMYNAMTNYITHGAQLAPSMMDHLERMSEKVLVTPLAKLPKAPLEAE